jgi:hypothetical protein
MNVRSVHGNFRPNALALNPLRADRCQSAEMLAMGYKLTRAPACRMSASGHKQTSNLIGSCWHR